MGNLECKCCTSCCCCKTGNRCCRPGSCCDKVLCCDRCRSREYPHRPFPVQTIKEYRPQSTNLTYAQKDSQSLLRELNASKKQAQARRKELGQVVSGKRQLQKLHQGLSLKKEQLFQNQYGLGKRDDKEQQGKSILKQGNIYVQEENPAQASKALKDKAALLDKAAQAIGAKHDQGIRDAPGIKNEDELRDKDAPTDALGDKGCAIRNKEGDLLGNTNTLVYQDAFRKDVALSDKDAKGNNSGSGQEIALGTQGDKAAYKNQDALGNKVVIGQNNAKGKQRGRLSLSNGAIYSGDLLDGAPHGVGQVSFPNGDRFQGGFQRGEFNGKGKYTDCRGGSYDGQFKKGKREGFGVYRWWNGQVYSGYWKAGQRDGPGTITTAGGRQYRLQWAKDKTV